MESLFACWYAGVIAVPVSLPRHQRVKHRLDHIVADAGCKFFIGTPETRQRLIGSCGESFPQEMIWIDPGQPGSLKPLATLKAAAQEVALLQYTSGSTGAPRGVVITHSNLMCNSAIIAQACNHRRGETIAGWLPLFHDMGLVGLLQAAFAGVRCVFMSPERFLMRPRLWLQMISDYRAVSSPAPNFAYDLCVEKLDESQKAGLDLSSWRNAREWFRTGENRYCRTICRCVRGLWVWAQRDLSVLRPGRGYAAGNCSGSIKETDPAK